MNRIFLFAGLLLLAGCGQKNTFKISGTLSGGDTKVLYLDKMGDTGMSTIDSVKLSSSGKFSFKVPAIDKPTFYYLKNKMGGGMNLLIDTVQPVSVVADYANLEATANISGSSSSVRLQHLSLAIQEERKDFKAFMKAYEAESDEDKKIKLSENYLESLRAFKDSVGTEISKMPITMASYYVLFQRINDQYLLFDEYSKSDYHYFATVATALNMIYPDDPRVKAFYQKTLNALKQQRSERMAEMIANAESTIPNIQLPNLKGDTLSLTDITNKVIILNFWASQNAASRSWNQTLKTMYNRYRNRGLEIYQVSVDNSKVLWENAMEEDGVTWKSVCDFSGGNSQAALSYNVRALPTTFLIDRNGDIQARVNSPAELEKLIKKHL